jgi:SAM-dependent methyltransferase
VSEWEASTYGEMIAEVYDEWYNAFDSEAAADCLADLAGEGPALELAIGTGRIALPLVRRGIEVHGIDASEAMVAKLRGKPDGDGIPVTIGDLKDVDVEGSFSLVFIVFNTIFCLATQDEQVACFQNVAKKLSESGVFVLEGFVPDLTRFDRNQRFSVEAIEGDRVRLEASKHDPAKQQVESRHIVLTEKGARFYPLKIRYAWPSELDLMARLAGLRLRERWGSWRRDPFTSMSTTHISVYEKVGTT